MANTDIWRPKNNNYSKKEALNSYTAIISHKVYHLILNTSSLS